MKFPLKTKFEKSSKIENEIAKKKKQLYKWSYVKHRGTPQGNKYRIEAVVFWVIVCSQPKLPFPL